MNPVGLVLTLMAVWLVVLVVAIALASAAGEHGTYDDAFNVEPDPDEAAGEGGGDVFVSDFDTAADQAVALAAPTLSSRLTDDEVDAAFAEIRAAWAEEAR